MNRDSHLSDQQLLLDVERELTAHDEKLIRAHLDACRRCRERRRELENTIAAFVRVHQAAFDGNLPRADGPRALLKARVAELSASAPRSNWLEFPRGFSLTLATAAFVLLILALSFYRQSRSQSVIVSVPDSRLTPGRALPANRQAVCAQANANNKAVPVALQQKVFEEYGITRAERRAYEVDYLITPALGGADDIHNLWPHSYTATAWNARVKDALEDRLREMVCDGSLDLEEAQKEIAVNWIAAYKKYFHTDRPLDEPGTQRIQ
jgi:hypothetical protein